MASTDWYCDVLGMEAFEACETFIVYLLSVFGAIYGLPNQLKFFDIQEGIKIFYPKKF